MSRPVNSWLQLDVKQIVKPHLMKIQYLEDAMSTFTMHMQIANQILEMIWTFELLFKLLAIQINHTQN